MEQIETKQATYFDIPLEDAVEYYFNLAENCDDQRYLQLANWLLELQELRKLQKSWVTAKKNLLWLLNQVDAGAGSP